VTTDSLDRLRLALRLGLLTVLLALFVQRGELPQPGSEGDAFCCSATTALSTPTDSAPSRAELTAAHCLKARGRFSADAIDEGPNAF
jgi:hypothetical protein